MYLPESFRETDEAAVFDLIREYPFATLITQNNQGLSVSHLPILIDSPLGKRPILMGHIARANPQAEHLLKGTEVLVIFHGPNSYISPRWYVGRENVPTWNYAAIHVRGTAHATSKERLREILDQSVLQFERNEEIPWTFSENTDLTEKFRDQLSRAILGFEISMDHIEAKFKLSQNREPADIEGAMRGLGKKKDDMSRAVLDLMSKRKAQKEV